jgi:deferrochelatase/peroxidase EfeB
MTTVSNAPDKSTIQGLILRGYTHPFSCHLLFNFPADTPTSATQAFFKALYPLVQNAEDWDTNKPARMLNIGLTFTGIQQLNVLSASDLAQFPSDFQSGPWSGQSQASLSDYGSSAPSTWWEGNFPNQNLHCVVHAYGLTQPDLDALISDITTAAAANDVQELFALAGNQERLTQYPLPDDEIHFGYRDGISEPALTWSGAPPSPQGDQGDLDNFLIGYSPTTSQIQPGPTAGNAGSFALNGCYNAFRILYQNVAAFNKLLQDQSSTIVPIIGGTSDQAQEWLAAKLMGRWRNGSPLILSPDAPNPATQDGELFGYTEPNDPSTYKDVLSTNKCPYSAHTRVANPRDEHLTPIEGTAPPRIVRRGVPYGPTLTGITDDGKDRGLIGLFLCGSFSRQFEKIYGWMNTNNFASDLAGLSTYPQDAVLGNRNPTSLGNINTNFTIPMANQNPVLVSQLPLLIETRGTAYCLLPSLTTIRLLAGMAP